MNFYPYFLYIPRSTWRILTIGIYILMHVLGSIEPVVDSLPGREDWSKVYHLIFYAGLAGMIWLSMNKPTLLKVVLWVMCAGALDEIRQSFFPFRYAHISDVLLDTASGFLGAYILQALQTIDMKRKKTSSESA